MKLHAHLRFESRDCDGTYDYSRIARPTGEEKESAFGDLEFKRRMVEEIISVTAEDGTLTIQAGGISWHENTEEGYRTGDVEWCEHEACLNEEN